MDHTVATVRIRDESDVGRGRASMTVNADILEAWAQGYMVGSLVILMLLVVCNYRKRVTLHKLILLEVLISASRGEG